MLGVSQLEVLEIVMSIFSSKDWLWSLAIIDKKLLPLFQPVFIPASININFLK